MYRGCKWSSSQSRRYTYQISENPAPGEYNVDAKRTVNVQDEKYREMARRFSYLPRYTEAQMLRLCAEVGFT